MKSHSPPAGSRLSLRELILLGLLGAVLVLAQVALMFLPNIELVSLLLIVYTRVFGRRAFYPLAVFILLEGALYGFGLWWVSYLYVWPLLVGITLPLRKNQSALLWAILSGGFGLLFGALCSIPYLFAGGPAAAISYWVAGIPFDLLHCAGNAAAALLCGPLTRLFEALCRRSGLGGA